MGMFDYVNTPEIKCQKCGEEVLAFQSKDLACNLDHVEYNQVNYFYSSCKGCGAWIEFNRKIPENAPLSDFNMYVDGELSAPTETESHEGRN